MTTSAKAMERPVIGKAISQVAMAMEALPILDSEELTEVTLEKILSSTSEADMFPNPSSLSLDDLSGQTIIVRGLLGAMPSTKKDSAYPLFLAVDCQDPKTGEQMTVLTGAKFACASLVKAHSAGRFPIEVEVVVKPNASDPTTSSHWLVAHR